ncbi:hypothetical protein F7725_023459 [Dissostichus mawsoni]|uniref:Uncharacterized protein n=1 Tax=Dissostichus mawsoni TaxID=36200 RepID=A0A7J5Z0R9_DISMA|nr:hypothetical protein F7725_023459 [Dissostichus mawsoni]
MNARAFLKRSGCSDCSRFCRTEPGSWLSPEAIPLQRSTSFMSPCCREKYLHTLLASWMLPSSNS